MNSLPRPLLVTLVATIGSIACHSTPESARGEVVLDSEHLIVHSARPAQGIDDARVLPFLRVGCAAGERLLALELIVWDDLDGDGRRSAGEALERWAMTSDGARAEFVEWRELQLPPGDALRARLDAKLEHHGRFEGTWRISPDGDALYR